MIEVVKKKPKFNAWVEIAFPAYPTNMDELMEVTGDGLYSW